MPARPRHGTSWAGLAAGPAAWGVSTQLHYALAPWSCDHAVRLVPWTALALAVAALAGTFLSWRAWRSWPDDGDARRAGRFLALLGTLAGLLFAAVILLQGSAGFIFTGCEH